MKKVAEKSTNKQTDVSSTGKWIRTSAALIKDMSHSLFQNCIGNHTVSPFNLESICISEFFKVPAASAEKLTSGNYIPN